MHLQTKQNPKDSMTEQGIAVSCHNVRFRYFQQNQKNSRWMQHDGSARND